MDIRSNVDGLKNLLGVQIPGREQSQPIKNGATPGLSALAGDRATLSSAGSEVALMTSNSEVRMEKVAAIQAALATGTYSVPASAVAGKLVDAMMGRGSSEN